MEPCLQDLVKMQGNNLRGNEMIWGEICYANFLRQKFLRENLFTRKFNYAQKRIFYA